MQISDYLRADPCSGKQQMLPDTRQHTSLDVNVCSRAKTKRVPVPRPGEARERRNSRPSRQSDRTASFVAFLGGGPPNAKKKERERNLLIKSGAETFDFIILSLMPGKYDHLFGDPSAIHVSGPGEKLPNPRGLRRSRASASSSRALPEKNSVASSPIGQQLNGESQLEMPFTSEALVAIEARKESCTLKW